MACAIGLFLRVTFSRGPFVVLAAMARTLEQWGWAQSQSTGEMVGGFKYAVEILASRKGAFDSCRMEGYRFRVLRDSCWT